MAADAGAAATRNANELARTAIRTVRTRATRASSLRRQGVRIVHLEQVLRQGEFRTCACGRVPGAARQACPAGAGVVEGARRCAAVWSTRCWGDAHGSTSDQAAAPLK